jgi:protein gp37
MIWDPWTGCYKVSDGRTLCYYYGPLVSIIRFIK